jgi:molecular chaperone Hsp33
MLNQFSAEELDGMAEDDVITVTCEFCRTHYQFDADQYLKGDRN